MTSDPAPVYRGEILERTQVFVDVGLVFKNLFGAFCFLFSLFV